ncbi:Bug family tripartite tricarboxylate transporter substrate binding protein [Ottowia thiooxydans]|uniref:Tripartite-type tricarboxylate transporter receptor subunit TctC n=1 Tax=Ottowia thiooxydans TaxID=219182 RepID=A0ABV2Q8U4_9BURK
MKKLVHWLAGVAFAVPLVLCAQTYPGDKPVRVVVPFTPGSASDMVARVFADEMRKSLGGTFVVDNKPGGAGLIGVEIVSKAAPDGHTLLLTTSATHSAGPWLLKKMPYDPLKDFVHIGRVINVPFLLLVHPDVPAKNVREFLEYARKNPGLSYGYGSSTSQVAAATFSSLGKVSTMGVPYKSQPPAVTDLIGGQTRFMMADPSVAASHVKAGKLRALAITSRTRSNQLPDVPTLAESGMGEFDPEVWLGIGAAAGIPKDIADRLSVEIVRMGQRDDVRQRFAAAGLDLQTNTLAEHTDYAKVQLDAWGARIKDAGIQPE